MDNKQELIYLANKLKLNNKDAERAVLASILERLAHMDWIELNQLSANIDSTNNIECNNNSSNVYYRNKTLIEFDKELKDIINFEYELTETRSSYCAVFRTLGFGISWEYDLLNKTYEFVELRYDGLGNRTVFKGLGLTAKEAYNNRKLLK